MLYDATELIRRQVLTQLHTARTEGRAPESIAIAPQSYHHFLVAFMHQISMSHRGVELFGIPLVMQHDVADIAVSLQ